MNAADRHVAELAALDADALLERAAGYAAHVIDLNRRGARWATLMAAERNVVDAVGAAARRGLSPVAFRAAAFQLGRERVYGAKAPQPKEADRG